MKKRIRTANIELGEDVHQFKWIAEEGRLELLNAQGELSDKHVVSIGDSYLREGKGSKMLRLFKSTECGAMDLQDRPIIYDRFLAIDTSYRPFGNNDLCVTASLLTDQSIDQRNDLMKGYTIRMIYPGHLVFLAKRGCKPERYGWMRMIDALLRFDRYNTDWSYGIVVDSDLKEIPRINAGKIPIFGNCYIPDNADLIYASADSGMEGLVNKLIRLTDRVASNALEIALQHHIGQESASFPDEYCDLTLLHDFPEGPIVRCP